MLLGIDSADRLTPTMIESAATALGRAPQVRVVYLDAYGGGPAEVALAHARGMSVVLCANSTDARAVQGTLEDGLRYGESQAVLARRLGAPPGTLLAVDIEAPWSPVEAWIGGVATGIVEAGYTPCVYGSLRSATPGTVVTLSSPAGGPSLTLAYSLHVPPAWYYSVTLTNAAVSSAYQTLE